MVQCSKRSMNEAVCAQRSKRGSKGVDRIPDDEARSVIVGGVVTGQRPKEVEWHAVHSMFDSDRMTDGKGWGVRWRGEWVGGRYEEGEYPVSLHYRRVRQVIHSNPYSTAMRHASLAFLLGEACCLRLRLEAKSSSQAGQECALSVDRGDLRGVCEI